MNRKAAASAVMISLTPGNARATTAKAETRMMIFPAADNRLGILTILFFLDGSRRVEDPERACNEDRLMFLPAVESDKILIMNAMLKVVTREKAEESDFLEWLSRSPEEKLDVLQCLREFVYAVAYESRKGFQRVLSVSHFEKS
jgi:hypothetical protein